uniref:CRAL-TRIO domain-containing protein n=1 Tax=Timema genevievae TaxID=629358 RepID=A0A7R9K9X6_TIMGE|nr:unnamed protein product [Timema genevievae]
MELLILSKIWLLMLTRAGISAEEVVSLLIWRYTLAAERSPSAYSATKLLFPAKSKHSAGIYSSLDTDSVSIEIKTVLLFKPPTVSYYCTTPRLTPSGYRISVLRLNDQDAHNFDISTIVKRVLITMDIRLNEERCLNNVIVFDLHGFTAQHFAKCSPTVPAFRKMMLCIQDAFPMRIAQIHLINAPVILEKVMSVLTPLLKEKLVQKFFIHSQLDTLYKYIPMEFLPKEYGGGVGTMKDLNDAWTRKMEEYRDWLLEDEPRSRADETRRPNRKKSNANSSALFLNDVEGSFRQLSID